MFSAACSGGVEDTVLDVIYNPCAPLVVAAAADASAAERDGITAALAMWNDTADTKLDSTDDGDTPRVRVRFDEAAPLFHGVYDDEVGEIIINRNLTDPHERAVTIAHELGHAFGLWHVDASERVSVMNHGNLHIEPNESDANALYEVWGRCVLR